MEDRRSHYANCFGGPASEAHPATRRLSSSHRRHHTPVVASLSYAIFSSLPESCEPPLFKGTPMPVGRLRLHHRPHICRTGGKTMTTSVTPYFVPFPAGPIPPRSSFCPFTSYYRIFNFEHTLTSTARHRGPLSTI